MSTVKVNTVDKRTGGTLTLGGCGTTVTLGAGATQSGFGRTGTVDWCTTAKTAPFTGVSGKGYFVNTTSGVVTVTLPATPTAGDIVSIADYANTWQTNNVTLCRNSSKINGGCFNVTLNTIGQSITLVYVDATRGWKNTMDSTSNITGAPNFIVATGGTITCCGDYKIHTFTADGCFSISSAPTPANNNVDYLVVAGGGSGGVLGGGGGGAGGYRTSFPSPGCNAGAFPIAAQTYPITVGGGAAASPTSDSSPGNDGSPSIFSTITSTGGGGGAGNGPGASGDGRTGGSGGGGNGGNGAHSGGAGNTPPVSPSQGNAGGSTGGCSPPNKGSGGGGAAAAGSAGGGGPGAGGAGSANSITGSPVTYAGGGGGGAGGIPSNDIFGTGGAGGGGDGGTSSVSNPGTINTGGGGGGAATGRASGAGGSGVVIIRYKYQ